MLEQEKYIFEAAEEIDELLESWGIDLKRRPLMASDLFVKLFILDVSHGDKEKPHKEPWFAIIHHHIQDWYKKTYGPAFEEERNFTLGTILIRSLPIALQVPISRKEIETEGERAWIIFPFGVDREEEALDWLSNPPNIEMLSDEAAAQLHTDVEAVAAQLRQIWHNTSMATLIEGDFSGFISGILPELETAAENINRNTSASLQMAVWSIQMAVERCLKAISIQKNGSYKESHDLFHLYDQIDGIAAKVPRKVLQRLPRKDDAVSARYGHRPDLTLREVTDIYRAGLQIISSCTDLFNQKMRVRDGRILIQMPPWLKLPSTKAQED